MLALHLTLTAVSAERLVMLNVSVANVDAKAESPPVAFVIPLDSPAFRPGLAIRLQ